MRHVPRLSLVLSLLALLPAAARGQAISYGGEIAGSCVALGAGTVSQVMTVAPPGAVPGQTVVIAATASTNLAVDGIVDSVGHTYAIDVNHAPGVRTFLASTRITSTLPASTGTITIRWVNSSGGLQTACANVALFSNLKTGAGYLDASGAANGNNASPTVTTGSATTQANDLVIGIFSVPDPIAAFVGPGFQGIAPEACIASPVPLCIHAEYRIVSATGTQTATAILGQSAPWDALAGVYKGASSSLPGRFYTLSPCRAVDTRGGAGPLGAPSLQPGATRVFPILSSACGIPSGARALAVNVTVTGPAAPGYLRVYPADQAPPATSVVNFRAGQTRANNAFVQLPADASGNVSVFDGSEGAADVVIDVNGFFQ